MNLIKIKVLAAKGAYNMLRLGCLACISLKWYFLSCLNQLFLAFPFSLSEWDFVQRIWLFPKLLQNKFYIKTFTDEKMKVVC